jgi:Lhr-like helicase
MPEFIKFSIDDDTRYAVAERFCNYLSELVVSDARGDEVFESDVAPAGRYWLGRVGPKDAVVLQDERADRLEPCAIGVRLRPAQSNIKFSVDLKWFLWRRTKVKNKEQRFEWNKSEPFHFSIAISINDVVGEHVFAAQELQTILLSAGGVGLSAEIRVRISGRSDGKKAVEITFVNTSDEVDDFAAGRFFECSMSVRDFPRRSFELESLPDSFRYDRRVEAFGLNCGTVVEDGVVSTTDSPSTTKQRPAYWNSLSPQPDFSFQRLSQNPLATCEQLVAALKSWGEENWSKDSLDERARAENWSPEMRDQAEAEAEQFRDEVTRVKEGARILASDENIHRAFCAMNQAMKLASRGKYTAWRPFQLGFLLANLVTLSRTDRVETDIVDIVWFATGGGKTETYLGLLITAAMLDRIRGKISGTTAWSRFPLRLLSLQQTQRFSNALAAAEVVRQELGLGGDPFSLGFLVGGNATPNRIKKESDRPAEDADKIGDMDDPYLLLDQCPFCRSTEIHTKFDRESWRLVHVCQNSECSHAEQALPIYVVDDEIWRFLPTIVVGTLDKAANIARQPGMRSLLGAPIGRCRCEGHGYTYARRGDFPQGCLVPGCRGGEPQPLPQDATLFAPTFRLQDELHLLRDSLGAVDSHYEAALDALQEEITGRRVKILASSATLAGYEKQVEVLYRRSGRVFPQAAPREGRGFWTGDSSHMMRKFIALAPRRLTVEFAAEQLILTLQIAVRKILSEPEELERIINVDRQFAEFLTNFYGTTVVYGNTLQDIDAVVRSAETQYGDIDPPPNLASLTGRVDFSEVRETLNRLQAPEKNFNDRLHLVAASSMMSHGVDIDRLNVMIMLALPLGVAEFIQATARVGRTWPGLVITVPKMTRERDASVYRTFPLFVSHGDRFVEPIPITRRSRRVLERTIAGLEMARILQIHEPASKKRLVTLRDFNDLLRHNPNLLEEDARAIAAALGIDDQDQFLREQLHTWFRAFARNQRQPSADMKFISDLSPTGSPMLSLRDVDEQAPIFGDSTK